MKCWPCGTAKFGLHLTPLLAAIMSLARMLTQQSARAAGQGESTLELPQVWTPTQAQPLPPAPPPLVEPQLPASFVGCWVGDPGSFDRVYPLGIGYQAGEPGEIEFCYYADRITIPRAQVRLSIGKRILDFVGNLALSFDTFPAHAIRTDIYSVSPGEIRARTVLEIDSTGHFLMLIPYHSLSEASIVDWDAKLAAADLCVVNALQVVYIGEQPSFAGSWHGNFRRTNG